MAGIYVHIPFCKSRCIYCGFYSTVAHQQRQRYVDAVCREWQLRCSELTEPVDTIYIGGGTPSLLAEAQLTQLLATLPTQSAKESAPSVKGPIPNVKEITIECNPDDVSSQYAAALSQLPVNRVSMGVQTFDDDRLRFLHRRHTAAQVPQAVQRLRDAGITNISIDLMYGFPGETLSDWEHDIDAALELGVEHLSAYCLMVEEGTPLYEKMRNEENEKMRECDEETERKMYEMLIDRLTAAGYEHYEISNFARPGYRSRHNSSYWHDVPYIGLGAAAHSYDLISRQWNVSDIWQYMDSIERGIIPCEREVLDDDTHYNDRITVALRTSDGLDLRTLSDRHRRYCLREAQPFISDGLLRLNGDRLTLTRQGLFVSDMVMAALVYV